MLLELRVYSQELSDVYLVKNWPTVIHPYADNQHSEENDMVKG